MRELPDLLRGRPFTVRQARHVGVTRRQLAGARFRRIAQGLYVEAALRDSVPLRCDAARLVLPDHAIFSHETAATLMTLPTPSSDVIHVAVRPGGSYPRMRGLRVHELSERPVLSWGGRPVILPARNFVLLAAQLDLEQLVVLGDSMLHQQLCRPQELAAAVLSASRTRGLVTARSALPLLEPRSASPGETRTRLRLIAGGFPRPRAGVVIYDPHGEWLAEVDLLLDDPPVIFQYDGESHFLSAAQRRSDAGRDEAVRDLGWEVVIVTNRDINDPDRLCRRATAACVRAAGRRVWGHTGQPPQLPLHDQSWVFDRPA
jgi:hypothetical protein